MDFAVVQTLQPFKCIQDGSSQNFQLHNLGIELQITATDAWTLDLDIIIFSPDTLSNFDTALVTSPANTLYSNTITLTPASLINNIYTITNIYQYIGCGYTNNPNIGIFMKVSSYSGTGLSVKVTECDINTPDISSGSKLTFYSPYNIELSQLNGATPEFVDNVGIKIDSLTGFTYGGSAVCGGSATTDIPMNTPSPTCRIDPSSNCRRGANDLLSFDVVQTLLFDGCISGLSYLNLNEFGLEFEGSLSVSWSADVAIKFFIIDSLIAFDPSTATELFSGVVSPSDSTNTFVTVYPAISIGCGYTDSSMIAVFMHVEQSNGLDSSGLYLTECSIMSPTVASDSRLTYYNLNVDSFGSFSSINKHGGISIMDGYGIKLKTIGEVYEVAMCTNVNPNPMASCGDGTEGGMCVDVFMCRGAEPNNPLMKDANTGWIQFIEIPSYCGQTDNPLTMTGINLYLLNDYANEGFMVTFSISIWAINNPHGIMDAALIEDTDSKYKISYHDMMIDDNMMRENWNYVDDFYDLWFGLDDIAIYGNECPDGSDCSYYWQLKLESTDRTDIGPKLIGCYDQSDALTFSIDATDTITDEEWYDPTASGIGNQFDIAYRMDTFCGTHSTSHCTGEWKYNIDVLVSVEGGWTSYTQWTSNKDTVQSSAGMAMWDSLQNYLGWNNAYCYDPWAPVEANTDCGCFDVESFVVYDNNPTQFDIRFAINTDVYNLVNDRAAGGPVDTTFITNDFKQRLHDDLFFQNTNWFDSTSWFDMKTFEITESETAELCLGDTTYYITASIEVTSSIPDNKWENDESSIESEMGMALYDTIQQLANTNNHCYNPPDPVSGTETIDCNCLSVNHFTINTDSVVEFNVRYSMNSDFYKLVSDWNDKTIKADLLGKLYERFSWYDSEISFDITSFEVITTISCPSISEGAQTITVEFEVSTDVDLSTWQSHSEDVKSVCVQSFIDSVYESYGTPIDTQCFSVSSVNIDDGENDRRRGRRLLVTTTIKIQVEITVSEDVYNEYFHGLNEEEFGEEFITQFQDEIQNDYGGDWYDDTNTQYEFKEASLPDSNSGSAMESSNAFIDFKEDPMQAGITGILLLAVSIAVFGYLNSWCRGADNFYITTIFFFGLYTWDFFSDVFFAALLYTSQLKGLSFGSWFSEGLVWTVLFIASLVFIIFPVLKNVLDLLKFQGKWMKHPLHADRYKAWINQYMNVLFLLSVVSGSTFGAIALVNSNFLGWRLFAMGLSSKDMREFNQRRLWNVIIGENLPQLLIQIAFTALSDQFELIAFLAICSSTLSIAAAMFAFASNQKFIKDESDHESLFCVKVASNQTEFTKHIGHYKNKTFVLATQIARMFGLDRNTVEILPSEKYSDKKHDGLVLHFFVSTSKKQPSEIYIELEDAVDCKEDKVSHLGKQIARAWGLKYGEQCDDDEQVLTYGLKWMNRPEIELGSMDTNDKDDKDKVKQDASLMENNNIEGDNKDVTVT